MRFKDARSVSSYPYNQPQILQMLSILNKLILQNNLQNFGQKVNLQLQSKKSNIKTFAGAGN